MKKIFTLLFIGVFATMLNYAGGITLVFPLPHTPFCTNAETTLLSDENVVMPSIIDIFDSDGQHWLSLQVEIKEGTNIFRWDVSAFGSGSYIGVVRSVDSCSVIASFSFDVSKPEINEFKIKTRFSGGITYTLKGRYLGNGTIVDFFGADGEAVIQGLRRIKTGRNYIKILFSYGFTIPENTTIRVTNISGCEGKISVPQI